MRPYPQAGERLMPHPLATEICIRRAAEIPVVGRLRHARHPP